MITTITLSNRKNFIPSWYGGTFWIKSNFPIRRVLCRPIEWIAIVQ